jgi:very-short-patch-repair endonuclease/DNA-binding CsgD family transcriptional regulator
MGKVLRYFNKEFFEKEILPHLSKNISAAKIGKFCKCSSNSVYKCMQRYATKDQINQLIQIGKTNSKKYKSVFNKIYFTNNILPLILKEECNQGIATILNIHPGSVRRCVKKYGTQKIIKKLKQNGIVVIKTKSSKSSILARQTIQDKLVDKDKERLPILKEMIEKGMDVHQIFKQIQIRPNTILAILRRLNAEDLLQKLETNKEIVQKLFWQRITQKRCKKYDKCFEYIKEQILLGKTSVEIANIVGCNKNSVKRITLRNGNQELVDKLVYNNKIKHRATTLKTVLKLNADRKSKGEALLYEIVKKYFPTAISSHIIKRDLGRVWIIDVAILEHKLALEFDGTYWHQDLEKDLKRDASLLKRGWKTIRFRYDHTPVPEELEQRTVDALKDYIK